MLAAHGLEMPAQVAAAGGGQHRDAVLVILAASDGDLVARKSTSLPGGAALPAGAAPSHTARAPGDGPGDDART